MDKKKYEYKGVRRYHAAATRDCPLGVISFDRLVWTDHVVRIINLSVLGAGIESKKRIEPGLVWFKERVGGYKCGVLKWRSEESGPPYQAGIEFLSLPRNVEEYLQEQVKQSRPRKIIPDPDHIIAALITTMHEQGKETGPFILRRPTEGPANHKGQRAALTPEQG